MAQRTGEQFGESTGGLDLREAFPVVYEELRAIAAKYMISETPGATLQPTVIVHEAFAKLAEQDRSTFKDANHFRAIACTAMRRILVDHARRRGSIKRGGDAVRIELHPDLHAEGSSQLQVLAVDEALTKLATQDPRAARVVELKFFGGMTVDEAASVMGISPRLVDQDWQHAKAWLARELHDSRPD